MTDKPDWADERAWGFAMNWLQEKRPTSPTMMRELSEQFAAALRAAHEAGRVEGLEQAAEIREAGDEALAVMRRAADAMSCEGREQEAMELHIACYRMNRALQRTPEEQG